MVRRLPVLQSGPQTDPPLRVPQAALLSVPAVLLVFASLLWGLHHFGIGGVALGYLAACALGAGVVGHRVPTADRVRFGLAGASATAVCAWGIAVLGSAFESAEIAGAALGALLGLGGAGFALGIFGLFRRQRATAAPGH